MIEIKRKKSRTYIELKSLTDMEGFFISLKKILGKGLKEIVTSYKMRQKISHSYQK